MQYANQIVDFSQVVLDSIVENSPKLAKGFVAGFPGNVQSFATSTVGATTAFVNDATANFTKNPRAFVDVYEKSIMKWANPTLANDPAKSLPLGSLYDAGAVALAYLAFVLFGTIFFKLFGSTFIGKVTDKLVKFLSPWYNMSQVILCSYMAMRAFEEFFQSNYRIVCSPFSDKNTEFLSVIYVFYLSKVWDFWDTIFMILRSKWDQLSFLHVYHHTSIFLIYWLNTRVAFGGDIWLTVFLNSLVHVVMYLYYFLSPYYEAIYDCEVNAGNKKAKKGPWWKSVVTQGQLVQFFIMVGQGIYLLTKPACQFPRNVVMLYVIYICSLIVLFMNFYIKSYVCGGSNKQKEKIA